MQCPLSPTVREEGTTAHLIIHINGHNIQRENDRSDEPLIEYLKGGRRVSVRIACHPPRPETLRKKKKNKKEEKHK